MPPGPTEPLPPVSCVSAGASFSVGAGGGFGVDSGGVCVGCTGVSAGVDTEMMNVEGCAGVSDERAVEGVSSAAVVEGVMDVRTAVLGRTEGVVEISVGGALEPGHRTLLRFPSRAWARSVSMGSRTPPQLTWMFSCIWSTPRRQAAEQVSPVKSARRQPAMGAA